MPEPSTPGQIAFAAYWRIDPWTYDVPWAGLTSVQQRAWEAAAQAAIAQWWRAHEAIICGKDDEEERDDG